MSCSVGELPVSSTSSSSGSVGGGGCRLRGVAASPMGATVPPQVAAGARRAMPPQPNKPCCFCWCCCCSCSCLALKNAEDNGPMKKDPASTDLLNCSGEPPSLEEIRTWGKSFEKLMKSDAGREFFRKFLCLEFSEENILFWLACEELKRHEHDLPEDIVEEKARKIYEDYISILSPKEVSLDSRVREIVNKNMVKPTTHTFDEAQLQIYTLMHRDSYPRFVNSPQYKLLAQLQSTNSTEGDAGPQSSLGAISAPESPQSDRKTTTQ